MNYKETTFFFKLNFIFLQCTVYIFIWIYFSLLTVSTCVKVCVSTYMCKEIPEYDVKRKSDMNQTSNKVKHHGSKTVKNHQMPCLLEQHL